MEGFEMHRALQEVWAVINIANKVVDSSAPWEMVKDETRSDELDSVLYALLETQRIVAILVSPVLVEASGKMLRALKADAEGPSIGDAAWGGLEAGTETERIASVFPRMDVKKGGKAGKKEKGKKSMSQEKSKKEDAGDSLITFEQFQKIDLRVGEIVKAEPHPNADRLLKLAVRCPEERTIVAGIAEHFRPEELEGMEVIVVANLKPVKLRGIMSEGMILAARDGDKLVLSTVTEPVAPGSGVS
jgi:methionyl-tRNA synthetase